MSKGVCDLFRQVTYPLVVPMVLTSMWVYAHVQQRDWTMENQPVGTGQAAANNADPDNVGDDAPVTAQTAPVPAAVGGGVFAGWMSDPSDFSASQSAGYFGK